MLEVEKVIEYFVDEAGTEIEDPEKNGKGIVIEGETYREGDNARVVIPTGEAYEGLIKKISTLKPGSNKNMVIMDESEVEHAVPYELFEKIEKI